MKLLSELVADLLVAASAAVPGATDIAPPVIEQLEPHVLQQKACGKPCRVLAWFGQDAVIYLDNRVKPLRNLVARSILLHELVHHVQYVVSGNSAQSCSDWLQRERDAYKVQAAWLVERGIEATPLVWQVRLMRCDPDVFDHGQAHKK